MGKIYQHDSIKSSLLMQKVATQNRKNQVISKASSNLFNLLINNNYSKVGTKIIACDSSDLKGTKLFDGVIKFAVHLNEGKLSKELFIPVRIVKSQVVLPDTSILLKKIASVEAINKVKLQAESKSKAIVDRIAHNFEEINKPFVYKKAYENTTKDKVYTEKKYKDYIGKVEKVDYPVPETENQKENKNNTHTLSRNSHSDFLEHFQISKSSLPLSTKIGDVLNFADKKYKVTSDDGKGNWGLDYFAIPVKEEK